MSIKQISDDKWLVQVQRNGNRKTKRVTGARADAELAEKELAIQLSIPERSPYNPTPAGMERIKQALKPAPEEFDENTTLRDWFHHRWVEYSKSVQNDNTRYTSEHRWQYLLYYLGDKPLSECGETKTINWFTEQMRENGAMTFARTLTGGFRKPRVTRLKNATINKSLQCLKSALNLAFREGVIRTRPFFDLLPQDDSTVVLPPTEDQYKALLAAAESLRDNAPYLPEIIEFTAQTGMRRAEVFTLRWRSVDWRRGTIRVETQPKSRMVNGELWKPKHGRSREIPMSARVKAVLEMVFEKHPHDDDDLVFPNRGGSPYYPYYRVDTDKSRGRGYFYPAIEIAGLKGKVTFHSLRHKFAVDLLTRGVPITIVSELIGHTDIQLTVKRYGRFSSDAQVKFDAIKVLDTTNEA